MPDCARGWLCLYEHIKGGGRRLIFRDEYVQTLVDYGFHDTVSSYRNRQTDGEGNLYDVNPYASYELQANAYVSYVGWFNDLADWVHP